MCNSNENGKIVKMRLKLNCVYYNRIKKFLYNGYNG